MTYNFHKYFLKDRSFLYYFIESLTVYDRLSRILKKNFLQSKLKNQKYIKISKLSDVSKFFTEIYEPADR